MNKKGYSLAAWIEVAAGIILFVACVAIFAGGINELYGTNVNPTFGIVTNDTQTQLTGLQSTLEQGIKGEATTSSITGVSLGTAWGMTLTVIKIGISVATGSWIQNVIGLLGWGAAGDMLGLVLRLLFTASIILIILRLIFKVNV